MASAEPAYFELEFHVGEDFDQLVFIEVGTADVNGKQPGEDGWIETYVPYPLNNVVAGWSDVKDEPEGTLFLSALVQPFEGTYERPDGSSVTYTLADGRVRYSVSKEVLEALQADERQAGTVDLFLDLASGQRVKVGEGNWSRAQRTTETFA